MIEAVGETLAPFVNVEKPQKIPWPATIFIKSDPQISSLRSRSSRPPCTMAAPGGSFAIGQSLFLLRFCTDMCRCGHTRGRRKLRSTRPCIRRNYAAHYRGKPIWPFPICRGLSQFCNSLSAGRGPKPPSAASTGASIAGIAESNDKIACRRVGQTLTLFPHLRRSPNWPNIKAAIPAMRDERC
jgi:hypothetical protein